MTERDQDDVLRKKGNVTKGDQGLQQWGDEGTGDASPGTASTGTAERAARLTRGQKPADEPEDPV